MSARVRTYPDNAKRARRLLALENEARAGKLGLWAEEHWRVRALDDLIDVPYFSIVEGVIRGLAVRPGDGDAVLSASGIRFDVGERRGFAEVDVRVDAKVRGRGRIGTHGADAGGGGAAGAPPDVPGAG